MLGGGKIVYLLPQGGEMGELPMGRCSLLVGLRYRSQLLRPIGADDLGALENVMAVTGAMSYLHRGGCLLISGQASH